MTWKLEYLPEAISDLATLDNTMKIIVISARAENKVYNEAGSRRLKHNL